MAFAQANPPPRALPPALPPPAVMAPLPADAPRILRLDEAVQTALQQQPQLFQARANAEAAEGRVIQARSPLLPQLSGDASYNRIHSGAPGGTANNFQTRSGTFNSWSFGVSGNQLLWDFGQTWNSWRGSQKLASSLNATAAATVLQVTLAVRSNYFQARATRDLVRVAQATLDNQVAHQRQVEGFVKVGTRPEIDLALARLNVANARVQLITAQNNDAIAKAQLNQAMGNPRGTDYQVGDDELPPVDVENGALPGLWDVALQSRPEIASFEYARQAQEKFLASARGAWGPSLSFSGAFAKQGPAPDSLYDTWSFGFALHWPFFQGGLTYGRVREAEQNLKSSTAALQVERLQIQFDVEQAEATLQGNKESVVAAQDAQTNAREQLRLAEGRYQAGIGTIIELSDAQVQLTNAAAQLVQAQYNLATARARLLAALGREQ
jgi:outer membrane protein